MLEKLKEILSRYVDVGGIEITRDTLILRDLGLNSYALTEMAGDVEDEFDLEFPDSVLSQVKTVGDVLDFIEENR